MKTKKLSENHQLNKQDDFGIFKSNVNNNLKDEPKNSEDFPLKKRKMKIRTKNRLNGYILLIIGISILIFPFIVNLLEKYFKKLAEYLSEFAEWQLVTLLLALIFISLSRCIITKNTSFKDKYVKIIHYVTAGYILLISLISCIFLIIAELLIHFKIQIPLNLINGLNIDTEFLKFMILILIFVYITFVLFTLWDIILMFSKFIVNRINRNFINPVDRYTFLLTFFGIIISLIALLK